MSNSYSGGPDQFPPILVKKLQDELAEPIAWLFTVVFEYGVIPDDWLGAVVIPIYKGAGSKADPKNYRPLSLTSVFSKLMEKVVKDEILDFLTTNNLISPDQHGFLPGRSTLSQLLDCINDWMNNRDADICTDVIYLDLKKAFDSVVHSKLLHKCYCYGIRGKLLDYIKAFLSGRSQRVRVGCEESLNQPVLSGVPQGSVLGPLLFILYINDLPNIAHNSVTKLYADDSKIYMGSGDPQYLQDDIGRVCDWFFIWQLSVNFSKCLHLSIAKRNNTKNQFSISNVCPNTLQ